MRNAKARTTFKRTTHTRYRKVTRKLKPAMRRARRSTRRANFIDPHAFNIIY